MSSKRKFSDVDGDTSGPNNKRKSQNRKQFRRDQDPPTTTNGSNNKIHNKIQEGRINSLKKRVRAIERLFNSGKDLPANVQNDMERELAHHKQKIIDLKADKQRRVMIKKYHMVRFFERKKADRLAKQIRRQLENATDEEEVRRLKTDLHTAEIDSIYARNFPYREPYISLYPVARPGEKSEDASSAAKALRSERPPMWKVIEQAAKSGNKALAEIRERTPTGKPGEKKEVRSPQPVDSFATALSQPKKKKKGGASTLDSAGSLPSKGKRKPRAAQYAAEPLNGNGGGNGDDDSDSDGGFFEED